MSKVIVPDDYINKVSGKPYVFFPIGAYTVIYWIKDNFTGKLVPVCGRCVTDVEYCTFETVESGSEYDHSIKCDNCYYELCDHVGEYDG